MQIKYENKLKNHENNTEFFRFFFRLIILRKLEWKINVNTKLIYGDHILSNSYSILE